MQSGLTRELCNEVLELARSAFPRANFGNNGQSSNVTCTLLFKTFALLIVLASSLFLTPLIAHTLHH